MSDNRPLRVLLKNTHRTAMCDGRVCVVHNPSRHHMSGWPIVWKPGPGIVERVCEHGLGHPDPDQFFHWDLTGQHTLKKHRCDGCCTWLRRPLSWLRSLRRRGS